jgi:hypothetical protein
MKLSSVSSDTSCRYIRRPSGEAKRSGIWVIYLFLVALCGSPLAAQTGGEAGIQGTVVDATGAVIPNATVTATNNATGVSTTQVTSSAGLYTISPIIPGVYTVSAKAAGFSEAVQQNLTIDALRLTGLNLKLAVGQESQEVTVTLAPPALETTNATLGAVLENKTYENLPLQMSGQQRDPTAFATLVPGTTTGARAPVIGGTGNYLAAVYVDGVPDFTINQQGDNRVVSNSIPVEAIDQFQVVTSSPDAEYEGITASWLPTYVRACSTPGVMPRRMRPTLTPPASLSQSLSQMSTRPRLLPPVAVRSLLRIIRASSMSPMISTMVAQELIRTF